MARRLVLTLLLLAVAAVLFVAATDNDVYQSTSPSALSWHVLLRKTYSIGAFALVGALYRAARKRPLPRAIADCALAVALYSAGIEVAQRYLAGSREGLAWNTVDVLCGALGGAIGAAGLPQRSWYDRLTRRGPSSPHPM